MFLDIVDQPQAYIEQKLSYLYVSLSNICNAYCHYCDVHDSPKDRLRWDAARYTDLFQQALDLGCRTVHFLGGGEPMAAPGFEQAVTAVGALGLPLVLTTNGSLLEKRLRGALGKNPVAAVLVSLDSHRSEEHDRVRGFRGLLQRATAGMAALRRVHPQAKLVVNHVVTGDNYRDLSSMLDFCAAHRVDALNLIPVKDHGELAIPPEHRTAWVTHLPGLRAEAADRGILLLFDQSDAVAWDRMAGGKDPGKTYRCVFPEHALYVDCPTGDVFPCDCTVHRNPLETFVLGNVAEHRLAEIWHGEAVQNLRRVLQSPCDPGCKVDCDWNNKRTNGRLLALAEPAGNERSSL